MKIKLMFSLVVIILLLGSCKKDKAEIPVSLAGKWNVENVTTKDYDNGIMTADTEPGNGATFDFQDNGNVLVTSAGVIQSFPYAVKTDSKVVINNDTLEIRNLTATNVTLFSREDFAPGKYEEIFINLER